MAVNIPPKITNQPQELVVHTRIKLDGNGHFLLLTMAVSACNIRFFMVFDTNSRAVQRIIWFMDKANDYFWPNPKGKNPHFQMRV